jgi:hypothetical protein
MKRVRSKSANQCQSVIQTFYDIAKGDSGELKEKSKGSTFLVFIQTKTPGS